MQAAMSDTVNYKQVIALQELNHYIHSFLDPDSYRLDTSVLFL